ncbi:hypothetical protein JTE90_005588 [Oedothorax gibbosus]|uniref:Battenin n=1 Tax=Oedothorax gibbosus TaxID=931172 RepID=A0AAV6VC62_9ARAC|nr:hypothetical protein JTE90_005588 [Oedothorax gibbosus]
MEESTYDEENTHNHLLAPVKTRTKVRNLVGFWLLGLCNNYAYVIMLSAAYDLLNPDYHGEGEKEDNNTATNTTRCNEMSTGAILLADILPALFIKLVAPFIAIRTHGRVLIAIFLCSLSFIITSFSVSHWMTFLGVICAALSSGLGEVTYLSYSTYFDKNVISTWASGTGGAGLIGALSYLSLTSVFSIRVTLQIMLIMPVLTAVTFWVLIEHPTSVKISCRESFCYSERKPMLDHGIDLSVKDVVKRKTYTFNEKITLIKPLLKYMIPLGLVYFAEYFINQGLMELLYFPNESSWLPHKKQYRWYQVIYQFGVLVSRSSVNIFHVHKLWILPILQFVNLVVLLVDVPFFFIPSIWIVFAIILYEGLLGGCAYVNTFYKITSEIPEEDREFSMGIASLGDAIGIALAGAISLPVHDALCKLQ